MKKLTSVILAMALLAASSVLTRAQAPDFQAEIAAYLETHTVAETGAYVQARIAGMSNEALPGNSAMRLDTRELLFEEPKADGLEMLGAAAGGKDCLWNRRNACRHTYNSEILTSAAVATGIFAGCNAITALTGFIICTAGALGAHSFGIASARERRYACDENAVADCQGGE